ncbi:Serine/threonine protein kinase [Haloechinothrix alba]|uniref:non-specific serine/threonine protein kinase n=1 Tax=Haloechinothrix alba TaxID=664784 RepID=A0A238VFD3_9PSEU|nr:serine/threonine-protein kinase [Haloechinothrix alba]SNR32874.1 Serine/threonine protein kinase [Haloechinothrix alba]
MDVFAELAGSLLSWAYQVFSPGVCPGDWVYATSTAGALIGLFPVLAAFVIAVIRRFTANRYNAVTLGVFGGISVLCVLVVPWMLLIAISDTYRTVFAGGSAALDETQVANLNTTYCGFIGDQSTYLGGGRTVYETVLPQAGEGLMYVVHLGGVVGLPLLILLVVMLHARLAFRRGPAWPARLFWVPFLALVVFTAGISANTAMHAWIGLLVVSVLGLAPVSMVGPPSRKAVRRSEQSPHPPPPPSRPEPERPRGHQPTAVATAMAPAAAHQGGGRYRRMRKLGHGGFGTVWQAQDSQLGRTVALKIAHNPDHETVERMQREARALAAVDHPSCVRVYDLAEEHDGLALVMEYLDGSPLSFSVDEDGPVDDVRAARLWSTLAAALLAAHDKHVLHRDVKPSNVIVDPSGSPHLIDFGIARSKGDASMTATGMMIGTPDYTAPEVAAGEPASPASDAWQLAATVSYALTGKPPRGVRETAMAALSAAARAEAPSELPERSAHAALLARALDPDPRNRPSLREVVREVDGWLARAGASAQGPVTRVLPQGAPRQGSTRIQPREE